MNGTILISAILMLLATLAGIAPGESSDYVPLSVSESCTEAESLPSAAEQRVAKCRRDAMGFLPVVSCSLERALMQATWQSSPSLPGKIFRDPAPRKETANLPASIEPPPPRVTFRT